METASTIELEDQGIAEFSVEDNALEEVEIIENEENAEIIDSFSHGTSKSSRTVSSSNCVRRSRRDITESFLNRRDVRVLLERIRKDHHSTLVLKIKDHITSDINSGVIDAIIDALSRNSVCQALYIQNFSKAIQDTQLRALIEVFKCKKIWCLNIGENYEVSKAMWIEFTRSLPTTNITHLYVSEHVIPPALKNEMRANIRENRQKHTLHCSMNNLTVIEKCTNMWWNPINGVRELKPYVMPTRSIRPLTERALDPNDVAFWQQGLGKGGERAWKFRCSCKEECSSYENCRYHPTGRMYECSYCSIWCHVDCVLGPETTDDDIEEMEEVLCYSCRSRFSRSRRYDGPIVDPPSYLTAASKNNDKVIKIGEISTSTSSCQDEAILSSYLTKRKEIALEVKLTKSASKKQRRPMKTKVEPTEDQWVFKCSCQEECSWYENKRYHPTGAIFSCSICRTRGHVVCMIGENVTEEQVKSMEGLLCFSCRTKANRGRRNKRVEDPLPDDVKNAPPTAVYETTSSIETGERRVEGDNCWHELNNDFI